MKPTRLVLFALLAGVIGVAASCTDRTPSGIAAAPQASFVGDVVQRTGLLRCTPLPYESTAKIIGPSGGSLRVGPHTLVVPPGALAGPVRITAVLPRDTVNVVRFTPRGLTFARPAALTMSYANCNLLGRLVPKRIAYTNERLWILEYLESIDDLDSKQVTGRLKHFSQYAVAW